MSASGHVYVGLIDDDESQCRSLSRLLYTEDYQTVTYRSAEAFLNDRKHPVFDCLVLDISLPGISGIELRRRLAAVNDPTPVIYLTALDQPEVRAEAIEAGCVGFFSKNTASAVVVNAIRRATGRPTTTEPPNPTLSPTSV